MTKKFKKVFLEATLFGSFFTILTMLWNKVGFIEALFRSIVVTVVWILLMNWPLKRKNENP
jgi:hypothetical protein